MNSTPPRIHAREIAKQDKAEVAVLLARGLGYPAAYYERVLNYLDEHPTPAGFPKYGYLLEDHGTTVGAILLIFTDMKRGDASSIRCHVTSWYVEPKYRCFATLFFSNALKRENVTYLNISARARTRDIIKVQGFSCYSNGQFVTMPLLNLKQRGHYARIVEGESTPDRPYDVFDQELLASHARAGCITMWCVTADRAYPFVFQPLRFKQVLPGVQLVYCKAVEDLVRFIWPIGWSLARRGKQLLRMDANGPIPGLVGWYLDGMEPRFYKGPKPRLGDIAFTQFAMCGRSG